MKITNSTKCKEAYLIHSIAADFAGSEDWEEEAFRGEAVQTQESHFQAEGASQDGAEAGLAFQGGVERAVLSSSAQAEAAPSGADQTEAEAPGTAAAEGPRA